MNFYILLTEDFYNQYQGYTVDNLVLNIVQTSDERYVTSTNAFNEFPELFTGTETIVKLTPEDFPSSETLLQE